MTFKENQTREFHLSGNHYISSVILYTYFRTDWYTDHPKCSCCLGTLETFVRCTTLHNNGTAIYVYKGNAENKLCGVWNMGSGESQEEQTYKFECNTTGDSIHLVREGGFIYMTEIVVIGDFKGK